MLIYLSGTFPHTGHDAHDENRVLHVEQSTTLDIKMSTKGVKTKMYTTWLVYSSVSILKLISRAGPRGFVYRGGGALQAKGLNRAAQAVSGGRV